MLGEGVSAGFEHLGISSRTICYVEREAPAAAQLVTLMEAGALAAAPIWSDMLTFDGSAWRGAVDCVAAGFPCQDLSIAGRRAGLDGKRSGLFFRVLDIADACGAWLLVLENVSGIASATASVVDEAEGELEERAAARVLGELADRRWDAEWITLPASDVGANHGRARWFCIAWRQLDDADRIGALRTGSAESGADLGREELGNTGLQHQHLQQRAHGAEHPRTGQPVAHAERAERRTECVGGIGCIARDDGGRREADVGLESQTRHWPTPASRDYRSPNIESLEARGGYEGRAVAELHQAPLFAPGPADPIWAGLLNASRIGAWERAVTDDEAGSCPWAPATKPGVRMLVDGMAIVVDESRNHQLRQVGNGVVPLQAAFATVVLARRAGLLNTINALRKST